MDKIHWKAKWTNLAIVNFDVEPRVLTPYLPRGCEIDTYEGRTIASLVGFEFKDAKFRGIPAFFHKNFIEMNLRFYVRGVDLPSMSSPHGVVFIKEFVPRRLVSFTANMMYNESFETRPMCQAKSKNGVAYSVHDGNEWNNLILHTTPKDKFKLCRPDGLANWITARNWGFCKNKKGGTDIYRIFREEDWLVKKAQAEIHGMDKIYGPEFYPFLRQAPSEAWLVNGSEVRVSKRVRFCGPRGEFY